MFRAIMTIFLAYAIGMFSFHTNSNSLTSNSSTNKPVEMGNRVRISSVTFTKKSKTNTKDEENSSTKEETAETTKNENLSETTKETTTTKENDSKTTTDTNNSSNKEKNMEEFTPVESENKEVYFEKTNDSMKAFVPNYDNYSLEDVITILGEPDEILEDNEKIKDYMNEIEGEKIKNQIEAGKLTKNQGQAFAFQATDIIAAMNWTNVKAFIYDEDKPLVLFIDNKIVYISPLTNYINFKGELN